MRVSQLAFALSGFALVVSVGSLVVVRREVERMRDRQPALEAEIAALRARIAEAEARFSGAHAGDPSPKVAEAVPEELLDKLSKPKVEGGRIRVFAPADAIREILARVDRIGAEVDLDPESPGSNPDGFRLAGLREGGLARRLGFETGDVIHTVNDMAFRTHDEIAAAYVALGDSPAKISFDVTRKGKPLTIVLENPKQIPIVVPVP